MRNEICCVNSSLANLSQPARRLIAPNKAAALRIQHNRSFCDDYVSRGEVEPSPRSVVAESQRRCTTKPAHALPHCHQCLRSIPLRDIPTCKAAPNVLILRANPGVVLSMLKCNTVEVRFGRLRLLLDPSS